MENKIRIGLVRDVPDKERAWAQVERLHLKLNPVDLRRGVTFADLAMHYAEHELVGRSESIHPKAHTTIKGYERVLRNRLLPRWGTRIALGIEPLEVEDWLTTLKQEEDSKIQHSTECAMFVSLSRADPKATAHQMQVQLLSGGGERSLPMSRRCRHVITHLFSSGYAG